MTANLENSVAATGLEKVNNHSNLNEEQRQRMFKLLHCQPTKVLLSGKSHGWRSVVGCSPCGHNELDTTERLHFHALEKEMATHSSVLAWRIPGTGEPGGLPSMGSHSQTQLKRLSSSSSVYISYLFFFFHLFLLVGG